MKSIESEFVFALTNGGSEKALKLEIEAMGLGWRLSYQRRGFVTFKPAAGDTFSVDSPDPGIACARRLCLSLGKSASRAEALALLSAAGPQIRVVHEVRITRGKLEPAGPVSRESVPAPGHYVGTIVELAPDEFWTGLHRHSQHLSPDPGGDSLLVMPPESPSRAWLKLEEAARFFGLSFSPRDIAVELGCAPGGVVLALLNRGVSVIGVDPAGLAPVVMASAVPALPEAPAGKPWFYHVRKPAALTAKRDLAVPVTWFMSDMNQSPEVAIKECVRFTKMCPTIRKALITLKLTDLSQVAGKAAWFQSLREAGFRTIRLQQLGVHHRELALLALDR